MKIRNYTTDDRLAVAALFAKVYCHASAETTFRRLSRSDLFGVVAVTNGTLVGFHLRRRIAPDIAGDGDLCVDPEWRGAGMGSALTVALDAHCAAAGFAASVVVNSTLYETVPKKRSAEPYYRRLGYHTVFSTPATVVMVKDYAVDNSERAGGTVNSKGENGKGEEVKGEEVKGEESVDGMRDVDDMKDVDDMSFESAARIARVAHAGQVDKVGVAYLEHPLRVAAAVVAAGRPDLAAVAVLHDVVEDSELTLDDLKLSRAQASTLDALTRRPGERYSDYIERLRDDDAAVVIKVADLRDNLDLARYVEGLESLFRRYRTALSKLTQKNDPTKGR